MSGIDSDTIIAELRSEIKDREADLALFRDQLIEANSKLEGLVEKLNYDLKVARSIQKALVPTEIPKISGFEFSSKFVPSMHQGGDYFDIFEHDDQFRFGLIMAGTSGYTMSSLLLSTLLNLSSKIEARRSLPPIEVLTLIAEEMIKNMPSKQSADMFYGVVDRRNFQLNYCRIGEVLALHYDYKQSELKALESGGPAFVAGGKRQWKEGQLNLNAQDRIILCSPGVVDTKNLEGQAFGKDRLFASVLNVIEAPVHDVRNEIMYQLTQFVGEAEVLRDQSVLVANVKEKVIKLAT